jgi:pimeloyl-ACP methyl ester carboxylesterase
LAGAADRIDLIAGEQDELMDVAAYRNVVAPLGVRVTILPGVDHMGVVYAPAALAAIVAAAK